MAFKPSKLKMLVDALVRPNDRPWQVGDIVTFKEGLRNIRFPEVGKLAVISAVLEKPVMDESREPGSNYYRRKLDIIITYAGDDSDVEEYHVDSRRFRLATPEEIQAAEETVEESDGTISRILDMARRPNAAPDMSRTHVFRKGQWITPKLGKGSGVSSYYVTGVDGEGDPTATGPDDDGSIAVLSLKGARMRPMTLAEFRAAGGTVEQFNIGEAATTMFQ